MKTTAHEPMYSYYEKLGRYYKIRLVWSDADGRYIAGATTRISKAEYEREVLSR